MPLRSQRTEIQKEQAVLSRVHASHDHPSRGLLAMPGHAYACLDCGLGNVTGIQRAKVRDAVQTPQCTTVTPHKTGNIHSKCQECRGPETMKSVIHSDVCVLLAQSYSTLCDPRDCSPPGSSVHGMLQTRILEWVALPSSRGDLTTQGSYLCL